MDQGMIDWTAFLTDDAWFLPDPSPAGAELVADVESRAAWDEPPPQCAQHPQASADCCWRRAFLDSRAVGFEEEVAALGHFGMGFPDGCYPETVPGSFTATHVECGPPSSVLDDEILDMDETSGPPGGPFAEEPKEYPHKRKAQSPELIQPVEDDSDWTPDSPKKKRAKITPPARKQRKPRNTQVWFSKPAKPRIAAPRRPEKNTIPAPGSNRTAVGSSAPFANEARFAASMKRARLAREAATARRLAECTIRQRRGRVQLNGVHGTRETRYIAG
ncbi:hypothetical protein CCM_09256 [Cordyceps militaris CM01]|uniref:Uncharacterized protein n=1 Tax=Cordyceps militaris (strain CM01) TaxID=983644 RepID=G3JTW6_CORMM|nr:uncharacterized protein CCM_09256 [Cordyceps militaris CM01]EGX88120.1 hypothetical protein CCM_09256 [Cordyceps militaris CM01]